LGDDERKKELDPRRVEQGIGKKDLPAIWDYLVEIRFQGQVLGPLKLRKGRKSHQSEKHFHRYIDLWKKVPRFQGICGQRGPAKREVYRRKFWEQEKGGGENRGDTRRNMNGRGERAS